MATFKWTLYALRKLHHTENEGSQDYCICPFWLRKIFQGSNETKRKSSKSVQILISSKSYQYTSFLPISAILFTPSGKYSVLTFLYLHCMVYGTHWAKFLYIYSIYSYKKRTIQWVQYNVRCSAKEKSNVKLCYIHHTTLWDVHRSREIVRKTTPVITGDDELNLQRHQRRPGQSSRRSWVSVLDTVTHPNLPQCRHRGISCTTYMLNHETYVLKWNAV